MMLKALILDDDAETRETALEQLSTEGFEIILADRAENVVETVMEQDVHICAVAAQSPAFDGYELARRLRHNTTAGILLMGQSQEEVDIVLALEMGADDYISRPIRPREFTARIRTILRRTVVTPANDEGARPLPESYLRRIGDIQICSVERSVRVAGRAVDLTPIEFDVLAALATKTNNVLSRAKIIEMSRGDNWAISDRSIDQVISRLRQKLFGDDEGQRRIRTVHGRGYMLIEDNGP